MGKIHKPRSGSLAVYPRVRAKKQTPSFSSAGDVKGEDEGVKPRNFLGYKVGMTHVLGKNQRKGSTTFGNDISIPATVIETPPLKVFGMRAYGKGSYGLKVIGDTYAEKSDKHLLKKIRNFRKKPAKKKKSAEKTDSDSKPGPDGQKSFSVSDIEGKKGSIYEIRLLVHTQPALTGFGKKKPDVSELILSGDVEAQIAYAKEKLGKEITISDVFTEMQFVDVKAVSKGKGFQGPRKRAGIKLQFRKAKKARVVGSIGPWHPATVMWTVPRPGQMGYHTRTEFNKRVLKIGENPEEVNSKRGFTNYGNVKTSFVILDGSVPGPAKRVLGLRNAVREPAENVKTIEVIEAVASAGVGARAGK